MKRYLSSLFVSIIFLLSAGFASAATIITGGLDNNVAKAIVDFEYAGSTWFVDFEYGNADAIYGTPPPRSYTFTSGAEAQAVMDVINAMLNDFGGIDRVGSVLEFANSNDYYIGFEDVTPAQVIPPIIRASRSLFAAPAESMEDPEWAWLEDQERQADNNYVYAVFTELTSTPVPVPAAVWLFGSALVGLVGVSRRR